VLDIAITIFVASAIPALTIGYDWHLGLTTLEALIGGLILYWLVSRLASQPEIWEIVAGGLVLVGGILGMYFVSQAGHLEYAEKVEAISKMVGVLARFTPDLAVWKPQTNSVAVFLEGIFFASIGMAALKKKQRTRWIWICLTVAIGLGLLFSASRGAWLAILGAGCIWLAFYWRPARWFLLAGVGALFVLVIYVITRGSIEAINNIPVFSSVLGPLFIRPDRLEVYRNSIALIEENPFTGIGLGNQFGLVYSRYELLLPYVFLTYSHNLFLEVWLEQGLFGVAALVGLFAALGIFIPKGFQNADRYRAEAVWVGLIAIILHGVTDARVYDDLWCWLPVFILLGLLAALYRNKDTGRLKRLAWVPLAAVGILLMGFVLVFSPINAAWPGNLGAENQQWADLNPFLSNAQRQVFRDRARLFFQQSLAISPNQRPANLRLGIMSLERLDLEPAVNYLVRAHQADPTHKGAQKALGLAYAFGGSFDQAIPLLTDQLNIVDELNYWGWFFEQQNIKDVGLNAYKCSLLIDPKQNKIREIIQQLEIEASSGK
jgi:O-antigen ligase